MQQQTDPAAPTLDVSPEQQSAAETALSFVRERWRAFLALDPAIEDLQHRAAVAGAAAALRGDAPTNTLAKETISTLGELRQLHTRAVDLFEYIAARIPSLGQLGAVPLVPLVLVGTVLALAGLVTFIFTRVSAADRVVRAMEAGNVSPEGAADLLRLLKEGDQGAGARFSSTVKWVVAGLLGWAALRTVQDFV